MKALDTLKSKASIWHSQIAGILALSKELGKNPPDLSPYYEKLRQLYLTEGALAEIQDHSDIVVRAQGPAVVSSPLLVDVNWLFSNVQQQFKGLVTASFSGKAQNADILAARIPVLLTGIAPGSFYAGFRIQPTDDGVPDDFFGEESKEEVMSNARTALDSLTIVPEYVTDTEVDPGIFERLPDPALRDASLMAAFRLSPTGQRGIHTLQFSRPNSNAKPAELDPRDRVVLRETVVKKPMLKGTRTGSFVGMLRGVDLDKTRVMLREVDGIGSLRCAFNISEESARKLLGRRVIVKGRYEENRSGKPSMLIADSIEDIPRLV